jgi:hypothetical protein
MIEYLKLFSWKGLTDCALPNLGKVNVICGKNNSGKSTVMECISKEDKRAMGKKVTDEDVGFLHNKTNSSGGWAGDTQHSSQYLKLLSNQLPVGRIIYSTDIHQVTQTITDARKPYLGDFSFPAPQIAQALERMLQWSDKVVLVPPKRSCELSRPVNASDAILADGSGILNFLFNARNQQTTAKEYQLLDRMRAAFHSISGGYHFDTFLQPNNTVALMFRHEEKQWIPANDCGLGLQDLLVILYFAIAAHESMVLIEEPENHLHPDIQRKLIYYLREHTHKQYFLSTHSNIFLSPGTADRVFFCKMTDSVSINDVTSRAEILHELGYSVSDNLISDLIIFLEGPTDRPVIEEFLEKLGLAQNYTIKIWPMGGDNMSQLDLSPFTASYKTVALIDKDPGSKSVRDRFVENCHSLGVKVHQLDRLCIENYFTLEALRAVFKGQIPDSITSLDPNRKLEAQIGINVKRNNLKLAKAMSREDILATDLSTFFTLVKELLQGKSP